MASKRAPYLLSLLRRPQPSGLKNSRLVPSQRPLPPHFSRQLFPRRAQHTIPRPPAPISSSSAGPSKTDQPHYELTFTCVPCGARSAHTISKHGYHRGSVLVACPSCRNRHVISDHLGIFSSDPNAPRTVEEILARRAAEAGEQGRVLVKKGTLGEDGDVEFWEDGTETVREERRAAERVRVAERNTTGEADSAAPGSTFRSVGAGAASGADEPGIEQDLAAVAGEVSSGAEDSPRESLQEPGRRPTNQP